MPNGCFSPRAKTSSRKGSARPDETRNTWIASNLESATNRSPLGASRITCPNARSPASIATQKEAAIMNEKRVIPDMIFSHATSEESAEAHRAIVGLGIYFDAATAETRGTRFACHLKYRGWTLKSAGSGRRPE